MMRGRQRRWSDDEFVAAVGKHTNFTDVLRELGLRPAGGNHRTMKSAAGRLGVDTTHFTAERRTRGLRRVSTGRMLPQEAVFCAESRVNHQSLRMHALRAIPPESCSECGNARTWNGKPLTLQLDHRNGVDSDNRLANLRWLCPNCHSQTESFAGRGSRRGLHRPAVQPLSVSSPRPQPARRGSRPTVAL